MESSANSTTEHCCICLEQNDIVSFCDYLTEIKKKREKTIEILDDVILSSFIEMFGDPHENPKNWEFVDLKNKLLEDPQNGLYVNESMYGSGTPIARIDSFYGGILDEPEELKKVEISKKDLKLFGLNHNDIILSRTNSLIYLGKCALIEELSKTIVFESNMMRLKINPDKISPQFLIAYFLTNMARNHIAKRAKKAANQVSINQEDIMDMQIPDIPITAQQDFVKIVMKWFELKKKLRKDLTMLKDFINSTEFGLFSGKIELKEFKKSISL